MHHDVVIPLRWMQQWVPRAEAAAPMEAGALAVPSLVGQGVSQIFRILQPDVGLSDVFYLLIESLGVSP